MRKPKDEWTVPKFCPNAVKELLPVKAKGIEATFETAGASKDNDDDNSECMWLMVTATPAEPYELTDLHLRVDDETHMDARQLPNLIPIEQLKGSHEACSQTGLAVTSRAFNVESEEPNDAPDIKINKLPVNGTLVP